MSSPLRDPTIKFATRHQLEMLQHVECWHELIRKGWLTGVAAVLTDKYDREHPCVLGRARDTQRKTAGAGAYRLAHMLLSPDEYDLPGPSQVQAVMDKTPSGK